MGNGNDSQFWKDAWLDDNTNLQQWCLVNAFLNEQYCTVSESVPENGNWDMDCMQAALLDMVVRRIIVVIPPQSMDGKDRVAW